MNEAAQGREGRGERTVGSEAASPAQAEVARLGESERTVRKALVVNMHKGAGLGRILGTWALGAVKTRR